MSAGGFATVATVIISDDTEVVEHVDEYERDSGGGEGAQVRDSCVQYQQLGDVYRYHGSC